MLNPGSLIYVWFPSLERQRVLHPGKVTETDAGAFVAEFDEALAPEVGADVNVFREINGKFYQQGAAVTAICPAPGQVVIAFRRVGEPVSAESRGSYRVSVAAWDLFARVGKDKRCQLVDVSPEGFAAITATEHLPGTVLDVELVFEAQTVTGQARVQTIRPRGDGTFRCGFRVLQDLPGVRQALEQFTAAVQRAQLRRRARIA